MNTMSHILVYARSRSQLERAHIFLESSWGNHTYEYVFFHWWEDEKQKYRYDANIDRLIHRSHYDTIIFWWIPNEYKHIKNIPYLIVFENADHILYPPQKKTSVLLFWWQERQRRQWIKRACATISLHPSVRKHLCDDLSENVDNHYCLPAHLPPIVQEDHAELERSFSLFAPETVCIIGNDYVNANIAECLDITNGDITFVVLSSNQNATTHLFRQIHIWEWAKKATLEIWETLNAPRIIRDQDALNRASKPNHFTWWVVLLDMHLTSGISDTLAYAFEIWAPVITLSNSSIWQELRNAQYRYIFSLARTNEIKAALWELKNDHQIYTLAREIIEELGISYKKNTPRSSVHMQFLLEKPLEMRGNEKIV